MLNTRACSQSTLLNRPEARPWSARPLRVHWLSSPPHDPRSLAPARRVLLRAGRVRCSVGQARRCGGPSPQRPRRSRHHPAHSSQASMGLRCSGSAAPPRSRTCVRWPARSSRIGALPLVHCYKFFGRICCRFARFRIFESTGSMARLIRRHLTYYVLAAVNLRSLAHEFSHQVLCKNTVVHKLSRDRNHSWNPKGWPNSCRSLCHEIPTVFTALITFILRSGSVIKRAK